MRDRTGLAYAGSTTSSSSSGGFGGFGGFGGGTAGTLYDCASAVRGSG